MKCSFPSSKTAKQIRTADQLSSAVAELGPAQPELVFHFIGLKSCVVGANGCSHRYI